MPRQKKYCFTINNWTQADIDQLDEFKVGYCQYIEYAKEVGEQGTPHLQGFFILKSESSMTSINKISLPRAHLSVMMGSILENKAYCSKETIPFKWGQEVIVPPTLEPVCLVLLPMLKNIVCVSDTERGCLRALRRKKRSIYLQIAEDFPVQCIRHKTGVMQYINDMVLEENIYYVEREWHYI